MTDTERANKIITLCCDYYGTTREEVSVLRPHHVRSDVKRCRLVIAELINSLTGFTHTESAALVDRKRDTVTVRIGSIGTLMGIDTRLRREVSELKSRLTKLGV